MSLCPLCLKDVLQSKLHDPWIVSARGFAECRSNVRLKKEVGPPFLRENSSSGRIEEERVENIEEKAMKLLKRFPIVLAMFGLTACSSTDFESTWQDPSATSINLREKDVAAFLISGNTTVRRSFESSLANQLTQRGIETRPGFEVLPEVDVTNKEEVLRGLGNVGVDNAVFMRIVDRHQEATFVPETWYPGPYYDRFLWRNGRFYGPGFGGAWPPFYDSGYFQIDTIVSVDTQVYSVPDSKLLWAGLSRTMNPSKIDSFVKDLVSSTVKKLKESGMVAGGAG